MAAANPVESLPLVLMLADLAELLRCSRRTVERLHRAGRLPEPLAIPGRPRWSRADVLLWIDSGAGRRRVRGGR